MDKIPVVFYYHPNYWNTFAKLQINTPRRIFKSKIIYKMKWPKMSSIKPDAFFASWYFEAVIFEDGVHFDRIGSNDIFLQFYAPQQNP